MFYSNYSTNHSSLSGFKVELGLKTLSEVMKEMGNGNVNKNRSFCIHLEVLKPAGRYLMQFFCCFVFIVPLKITGETEWYVNFSSCVKLESFQ